MAKASAGLVAPSSAVAPAPASTASGRTSVGVLGGEDCQPSISDDWVLGLVHVAPSHFAGLRAARAFKLLDL